jgi:hypothetical protein
LVESEEVGDRNNALVRVINADPGAMAVDVFADNQKAFEAVSFKTVTPYKEISDTRHTLRVRLAGKDNEQPIAENSEGLTGGRHYTVLIMPGTNDKTTVSVISDNIAAPPADKAQVHVIHASPDVGEVDIVDKSANKKLFSGVNSERETSYMAVDPMKTTLEIRPEGQEKSVLTVPEVNFEKGKYYTIVVTGHSKGMPIPQNHRTMLRLVNSRLPLSEDVHRGFQNIPGSTTIRGYELRCYKRIAREWSTETLCCLCDSP